MTGVEQNKEVIAAIEMQLHEQNQEMRATSRASGSSPTTFAR